MRTRQQINEEYTRWSTVSGDLAFRCHSIQLEIDKMHQKMAELQKEEASDDPKPPEPPKPSEPASQPKPTPIKPVVPNEPAPTPEMAEAVVH